MDWEKQQAWEALRVITQAEALAARNSKNNGIVPLVWGTSVLALMIGFDVFPRLFSDSDIGLLVAGILLSVVPAGTSFWTARYQRRLPVQPLKVDFPRLFTYWGFYHTAVVWAGMGTGIWLGQREHLHCLPPFVMTLTGLVDAAPLLWVGWNQRRRTEAGWL